MIAVVTFQSPSVYFSQLSVFLLSSEFKRNLFMMIWNQTAGCSHWGHNSIYLEWSVTSMDLCQDHLVSIMTVYGLQIAFVEVSRVPITTSLTGSVTTPRLLRPCFYYLHMGIL